MDDLTLDKKIRWQSLFLFYALWGLVVILGFVIFFVARAAFRILLLDLVLREWINWAWANLAEKVLVVIVGVIILGFIVFVQDYLYKALDKNLLLNRFARVLGIGLLVLFIFNSILMFFHTEKINIILLLGLEFITGFVFTFYSFRLCKK